MVSKKHLYFIFFVFSIFLFISLTGCTKKEPIKIGLVGNLTGRASELAVTGRNGAELAVNKINKAGGINGHPVQLIIKDDKNDPATALRVDQELIDEGVAAIIGHYTSKTVLGVLPLINQEEMLMISPTVSINSITGLDDNFIRVIAPDKIQSHLLASNAMQQENIKKIAIVYDLSNKEYTEEFYINFINQYIQQGGQVLLTRAFTSGSDSNYVELAKELKDSGAEGILVVANGMDTALFCQHLRKLDSKAKVMTCMWAMTSDLMQNGGSAVEGILMASSYDKDQPNEVYTNFKKEYLKKYGTEPTYSSVYSYEAAQVLFKAIEKSNNLNTKTIKNKLLEIKEFPGLQNNFMIDQYGDAKRSYSVFTIKTGQFKRVIHD